MADINSLDALQDMFSIASYNCRGYNQYKTAFILRLLSQCHILCLQELWLSDLQIAGLSSDFNNCLCTGVSRFDSRDILGGADLVVVMGFSGALILMLGLIIETLGVGTFAR